MGPLADWTQLRKESLSLRLRQNKLPKWKTEEKKRLGEKKKELDAGYPRAKGQLLLLIKGIPERKERERNREYWKQ